MKEQQQIQEEYRWRLASLEDDLTILEIQKRRWNNMSDDEKATNRGILLHKRIVNMEHKVYTQQANLQEFKATYSTLQYPYLMQTPRAEDRSVVTNICTCLCVYLAIFLIMALLIGGLSMIF